MNTNVPMTTTVGYFNGNKYPIHLFISALNQTLRLEVGEYIKDRAGNLINDPFFDQYAMHPNQLTKEISEAPVPLNPLPPLNQTPALPPGQPPVREITEFTKADRRGLHQPIMPRPIIQTPRDPSTTSIQGMSVDEARKRGLIRPVRVVPEDYGADETTGQPPSGERIPSIKYATDVPATTKKPGAAAVVAPKPRMNVFQRKPVPAPAPAPVKTAPPPAVTPAPAGSIFGNRVVETVMAEAASQAASPSGQPAPAPVTAPALARKRMPVPRKPVPRPPTATVPPAPTAAAEPETELPAPPEAEPEPEPEPVPAAATVVAPAAPAPAPAPAAPAASPGWLASAPEPPQGEALRAAYVCLADGKAFGTLAELTEYVQARYPKQAKQLLEEYAEPAE